LNLARFTHQLLEFPEEVLQVHTMCHWRQILESDDNHLAMLWFIEEARVVVS